jgi:hypothetical protein
METNTNKVLSQPTNRKPIFGFIALILSLMPIPMYLLLLAVAAIPGDRPEINAIASKILGRDWYLFYSDFSFGLICLGAIIPIVGIILGITSLVRKETRKGFAIAGIALGILTGLAMCALSVLYFLVQGS